MIKSHLNSVKSVHHYRRQSLNEHVYIKRSFLNHPCQIFLLICPWKNVHRLHLICFLVNLNGWKWSRNTNMKILLDSMCDMLLFLFFFSVCINTSDKVSRLFHSDVSKEMIRQIRFNVLQRWRICLEEDNEQDCILLI